MKCLEVIVKEHLKRRDHIKNIPENKLSKNLSLLYKINEFLNKKSNKIQSSFLSLHLSHPDKIKRFGMSVTKLKKQ